MVKILQLLLLVLVLPIEVSNCQFSDSQRSWQRLVGGFIAEVSMSSKGLCSREEPHGNETMRLEVCGALTLMVASSAPAI